MDMDKVAPSGFRSRLLDRIRTHKPTSWRRNHADSEDDVDLAVEHLPRFRPRALSNERAFDPALDEQTHYLVSKFPYTLQQTQSDFFSRLPFHLRVRIFSLAVGSSTLHIRTQQGARGPKLIALDCVFPENEGSFNLSSVHPCWRYSSRFAGTCAGTYSKLAQFPDPQPVMLLGLLKSCRRAYTEAIDLLYSQSAFTFDRLQSLIDLSNSILGARLNKISRIALSWSFGSTPAFIRQTPTADYRKWQTVCSILAGMPHIRELVIIMKGDTFSQDGNAAWLEPLGSVFPRYTKPQVVLSFLPPTNLCTADLTWEWHYRTFGRVVTEDDREVPLHELTEASRQQLWHNIEGFSGGRTLEA